ncbi:MAG TPA: carbohydrate kinase family protein [Candidatus Acidoferrum sp.]|nr:carbohydrate kinase family protein [Candidatus Acidoferrum sp.]
MPRFDVSVVGELNLDLILSGLPPKLELERELLATDLTITLGSSSAIFTHNLALLGDQVGFSSAIGGDALGEIALEFLRASGTDVLGVRKFTGRLSGLTTILPTGIERYILTYPGTMFEMAFDHLDLAYILEARHLHLSSYYLHRALRPRIPDLFRAAKAAGLTTSLDTNDDPDDEWADDLRNVLPFVDVLLPNQKEACRIAHTDALDEAIELLAQKVPVLVVKRGREGAVARQGSERFQVDAFRVKAVDSVGAGDSFDAGFVHRFIRGGRIEECLRFASLTGALSATRAGGIEAFRDAGHRDKFLAEASVETAGGDAAGGR